MTSKRSGRPISAWRRTESRSDARIGRWGDTVGDEGDGRSAPITATATTPVRERTFLAQLFCENVRREGLYGFLRANVSQFAVRAIGGKRLTSIAGENCPMSEGI